MLHKANTNLSIKQQYEQSSSMDDFKHLINTAKVLKGHKITTKQAITLQLLKFRHSSQVNQPKPTFPSSNAFTFKYQSFDSYFQEHEIPTFVELQRKNYSEQATTKIKMFHQNKDKNQIRFNKTFNSFNQIQPTKQISKNKIKSVQNHQASVDLSLLMPSKKGKLNKMIFKSQNIGKRLNEQLNQVIFGSQKLNTQICKIDGSGKFTQLKQVKKQIKSKTISNFYRMKVKQLNKNKLFNYKSIEVTKKGLRQNPQETHNRNGMRLNISNTYDHTISQFER